MANRHMKRCSSLLIIREMQINTTMRYHLTPIRTAIIIKSTNNKCWRRYVKKETFLHCWWECKLVQPLWKRVWRYFRKLKTELPYDLAIPLLSIFPDKIIIWKDTRNSMFKVALFTIAKTWKKPKCPSTDKQVKKMRYIQWSISHGKEWNHAICSNMDGSRGYHTKQSQRKTNTIWHHWCVKSKIWHKWTYL